MSGVVFAWFELGLARWSSSLARLMLWAVASGATSMILYAAIAPQLRIRRLKRLSARLQRRLRDYDGDFRGAMRLARRNVSLALRRLWLSLGPSLLAGLPVILAMLFVLPAFEQPDAGGSAGGAWRLNSPTTAFLLTAAGSALTAKFILRVA